MIAFIYELVSLASLGESGKELLMVFLPDTHLSLLLLLAAQQDALR